MLNIYKSLRDAMYIPIIQSNKVDNKVRLILSHARVLYLVLANHNSGILEEPNRKLATEKARNMEVGFKRLQGHKPSNTVPQWIFSSEGRRETYKGL